MKGKDARSKKILENQGSLFGQREIVNNEFTYDRIIINLLEMPKKNPHHYLLTTVTNEAENLSPNGYILALSNQNLFVPSQKEKLKQFFESFELAGEINFENLKGKGEIQNYLYIFRRKRTDKENISQLLNGGFEQRSEKSRGSFINFHLNGNLEQFNHINIFTKEFKNCFNIKASTTPVYHKDLSNGFIFNFNQEIIVDGILLKTKTNDPGQVTHPNFFKNLTNNCRPFEHFFKIENITDFNLEEERSISNGLFETDLPVHHKFQYVLIVHFPENNAERVEIIPSSSFLSQREQYGVAFYQYFDLSLRLMALTLISLESFLTLRLVSKLF